MWQRCEQDEAEGVRPHVFELVPAPDPVHVFCTLAQLPHCLFLDSALRDNPLGRYSFVTADPYRFIELPADGQDVLSKLEAMMAPWHAAHCPDLPPFQGGAAGLWSYDLNRSFERLPAPRIDEFKVPGLAVGFYDAVVAFDHQQQRAWIISQGLPETEQQARRARACCRIEQWRELISKGPAALQRDWRVDDVLERNNLAPQCAVGDVELLTSNFPPEAYRAAIHHAIEYIRAGDIFQVNLAQRLLFPAQSSPVDLYLRLRQRNPAPFAGYFDIGRWQLVSASPERFVAARQGVVETRPIKGTRQRCRSPEADLFAADELRESEKDRAENVMIVDLLRNDLSRVCRPESVRVRELCRLETYEFVQHLVSVVAGDLAEDCSVFDLVRCAFPGGSITGAPKVRAMEIIQELEPTARGAYCGSLGYIGFDGTLDLSILIRTITAQRGWWQFPVGGGIVAQSDPDREYEETWHKAVGIVRALCP